MTLQDLTVSAALTPIPEAERSPRRVVHYKDERLTFSSEQIERLFWAKISKTAEGCWEWNGSRYPTGYGRLTLAKQSMYTHRISYEIYKGAIPGGLHIDHLCRNRVCCNPAHLEAVTCAENISRSPIAPATINAAKTHCLYGHEYTDANTVITSTGRGCRTCRRWRDRVAAAKKAGKPFEEQPPRETVTSKRCIGMSDMCHQGHPFDAENTYLDRNGYRKCRACAREHRRRYNAKQPAPAMTPADIAAHQAATHLRAEPLNPAAQAAMARLERALTPAVAR